MAKPTLQQMPVYSIGTWEQVRDIDNIINEAEDGLFYNAARLVDQVLRDDRIYSVFMTRVLALLGKDLEFEPAKDTAQGRTIAEDLEEEWPSMVQHSALVELLTWGLMLGVGLAQVLEEGPKWKLEVWHPWALRWDLNKRTHLVQANGMVEFAITPNGDGTYGDEAGRRWVLFTPFGFGNAGRRGLLRTLARLYLERQWALRDRARYSEVHGQPMRLGIAPSNADQRDLEAYKDDISYVGAEMAAVVRQGEPGNLWDLKLVEAMGRSQELFEQEIAQLDRAIASAVLGQSQTTDGQAGLGSNAEAGEPVRLDIMRADKDALSDALRAQFLVPYCDFTYGNGDMAPWLCWNVDPPEDQAALAKVHLDQANADNVYIQAGVLTPEEVAISRFGDEYTLDTEIDVETRQKILDLGHQQMEAEAQAALDQAKNPPDPMAMAPNKPANGAANGANGAAKPPIQPNSNQGRP